MIIILFGFIEEIKEMKLRGPPCSYKEINNFFPLFFLNNTNLPLSIYRYTGKWGAVMENRK